MKNEKAIEEIIAVCEESIESDRREGFPRQPIGRSDTFMIRNTLKSYLALLCQQPPAGEFTKNLRGLIHTHFPSISEEICIEVEKACSRLDAAEQRAKELEAELASARKELKQKTHLLEREKE